MSNSFFIHPPTLADDNFAPRAANKQARLDRLSDDEGPLETDPTGWTKKSRRGDIHPLRTKIHPDRY
jgi:hypothetical protein